MKKIAFLLIFLLQMAGSFAQTNEWTQWGAWTTAGCYSKISFRIQTISNPKINTTSFRIEFRSAYTQPVKFGWVGFSSQSEANAYFAKGAIGTQSDIGVRPASYGPAGTYVSSVQGAGLRTVHVYIYRLTIGTDYQHYQKCDDGTPCSYCEQTDDPYCPNVASSSSQNAGQHDVGQQNSTDASSQSQQRMQSDASRGDVKLQPVNQADANRKQQFLNVYNQGVALGNTGKYAEAADKYQEAIGLASNAAERQTAQNAYDKVRRGAAQTQAIAQVGTALTSAVNAWQKASEEKQQKREAETRALVEQRALYKEQLADYLATNHNYFVNVTTNRNNPEMKKYVEYVIYQFQKAGFSFKQIVRQCFKTEIERTSRNVTMDFIKGSKAMSVILAFDYVEKQGFYRRMYFVNKGNIDLSTVDLGRITTNKYNYDLPDEADPPVIPQNYFKGTSYRGFDKEIELKKENTIEAYTYNALFCHCFDNNVEESVYWNTKAIKAGDTESILRLASLYKFYVKDTPLAVYWYNEYFSLKPDSAVAETIAEVYKEATEPDYANALLWYKKAAEMGNAKALLGIGYIYAMGNGVTKDYGEASKWYLQAAEKGMSAAMKSLYNMYSDGGPNLEKNKSEAKKWRKKACEADPKWCKSLK